MASPDALVEAIGKAILAGNATSSTVATLQALLRTELEVQDETTGNHEIRNKVTNKTQTRKHDSNSNTTTASKIARREQNFRIHEDAARSLPSKTKREIATKVVNAALKALTDTSGQTCKTHSQDSYVIHHSKSTQATPNRSLREASSTSLRPLNTRSGNAAPNCESPGKAANTRRRTSPRPSLNGAFESSPNVVSVAECARVGFSHLRSADKQKPGGQASSNFQLETGMLVLVGKLISHNLDHLAVKELRAIKKRLETIEPVAATQKPSKQKKPLLIKASEKEGLASLLRLNVNMDGDPEILPLVILYHTNVLKLLSNSWNPATMTEVKEHLRLEAPSSPVNAILKQSERSGDLSKAAKQLEMLSKMIFGLCPSVSISKDEEVSELSFRVPPILSFQLQKMALRIQKLASEHVGKSTTYHFVVLFSKCVGAFLRRSCGNSNNTMVYATIAEAYAELGPFQQDTKASDLGPALFEIHRNLSTSAERAELFEEAHKWATMALENCQDLEMNHTRRIGMIARRATVALHIKQGGADLGAVYSDLTGIEQGLQGRLPGCGSDHEIFLNELSDLMLALEKKEGSPQLSASKRGLIRLGIAFATKCVRNYPGKGLKCVETLVVSALTQSRSTEERILWVTEDVARLVIKGGVLGEIGTTAASKPLAHAWSSSPSALTLSCILKALLLKASRQIFEARANFSFDDGELQNDERAALLEWQLKLSVDLARQHSDYRRTLPKIVPEILQKLDQIYLAAEYPLRRSRVGAFAMRLQEEFRLSVPLDTLESWISDDQLDYTHLEKDEGLRRYLVDIETSKAFARIFYNGTPSLSTLEPILLTLYRSINTAKDLKNLNQHMDNSDMWISTLKGLNDYLVVLNESSARIGVAQMLLKLSELCAVDPNQQCESTLRLSEAFLTVGHAEKAGKLISKAKELLVNEAVSDLASLQYYICYAEYLLAIDDLDNCRGILENAHQIRQEVEQRKLDSAQRKTYRILIGRNWLAQSRFLLASASPREALHAAKLAVKLINGIWVSIERSGIVCKPDLVDEHLEPENPAMRGLTAGVSKLNLKSGTNRTSPPQNTETRGVETWRVVPLLCSSLLHLSDLYAHHGVFADARYYMDRALDIAEAIQSHKLLSRVSSRLSMLLASGGLLEEAELCLAKVSDDTLSSPSLSAVQGLRARAHLHSKGGNHGEALKHYEKAESMIKVLQPFSHLSKYELSISTQEQSSNHGTTDDQSGHMAREGAPMGKILNQKPKPKPRSRNAATTKAKIPASRAKIADTTIGLNTKSYILCKIQAQILLEKFFSVFKMGHEDTELLRQLKELESIIPSMSRKRQLEYCLIMQKATALLQADFTFSVLQESTLCLPALVCPEPVSLEELDRSHPSRGASKKNGQKKSGGRKAEASESLEGLLLAARECFMDQLGSSVDLRTTAEVHLDYSLVSNATMLLSATSKPPLETTLSPEHEALVLEASRINATDCNLAVAQSDARFHRGSEQSLALIKTSSPQTALDPKGFREMFIDILPKPWTVVSLYLNESCDELFVSRYRRGTTPLILRLPFARHKPGGEDDGCFDFFTGKAELQDIIERSNYSCHNSGDTGTKGARSKWWNEREALDKRLQELLMNVENLWLGGFKGIFSQQSKDPARLAKFRQTFEAILERHLPSRQAMKRHSDRLVLDDHILELFIGLDTGSDDDEYLDELLSDLLYFVVDMLQFGGEHNAYDEVDFDAMSIDVLDALRCYHDASDPEEVHEKHMILVLDRCLQAFPWESLPCLENTSTSRVDSLRSLGERLRAMRRCGQQSVVNGRRRYEDGYHAVSRQSGTYILNPSGDLSNTEKSLGPNLATLTTNATWTAFVGKEPSQDDFKTALSTSSTLLYFGHGAGSQYIGSRAVRRLEQCSEVVWLVGCSSGAVNEHGDLEPSAIPLTYLVAGQSNINGDHPRSIAEVDEPGDSTSATSGNDQHMCMAVVAMLWDVTDKDIDRFSLAVGEEWGLWTQAAPPTKLPPKTLKKREAAVPPSTPRMVLKTPKTPKLQNTPGTSRTTARRQNVPSGSQSGKRSLVEAVTRSRDACYLRYLNGAAPVVYGVPVYLGD